MMLLWETLDLFECFLYNCFELIEMNDGIKGYKGFYKGLINKHNILFDIGEKYVIEDKYRDYGYHFCKNIEDVFIFFKGNDIEICEVIGSGDIINYYNDYYGVYDIYASSEIEIVRKVSRKEIINYFLDMNCIFVDRIVRFISLYKLSNSEIDLFCSKFRKNNDIIDAISYYQKGDVKVYERKYRNG